MKEVKSFMFGIVVELTYEYKRRGSIDHAIEKGISPDGLLIFKAGKNRISRFTRSKLHLHSTTSNPRPAQKILSQDDELHDNAL